MELNENGIEIAKSIWKYRFGAPEMHTPTSLHADLISGSNLLENKFSSLPFAKTPFINQGDIGFFSSPRGCVILLPVSEDEHFFGMGLQQKSVEQTGKKKTLRVNSDPVSDAGDSHAPVPFYLSSAGYGILVDTLRYASFYFASHPRLDESNSQCRQAQGKQLAEVNSSKALYSAEKVKGQRYVAVDIPAAKGVDIYLFGGPDMMSALRRYNLFSGGGFTPPMWGLGIWYRARANSTRKDIINRAQDLRDNQIPCDVLGLEPGWQTASYSCSFVWDEEKIPQPDALIGELADQGFRLNLWEHAFTHPSSPIYEQLLPYSGDYLVFNGLVPDFFVTEAAEIFRAYHESKFVDKGISGFKIDECDNSDYISTPWSFPETSQFPSGLDGELMHSAFGLLYQKTLYPAFTEANRRTLSAVRSSHALASSMPFVLYSDLYDHADYIRGMVNMGYSGLMWTPEVRHARTEDELIRRVQSVIFSPMALFNAWTLPHPPWKQYIREKNWENELLEDYTHITERVKRVLQLRMSFLPYLYEAFYKYETTGKPPFRGLPLDFNNDQAVYSLDDCYLVGDSLLFAPVFAGQSERKVYLPGGDWFDFFSGARLGSGWHTLTAEPDGILLFARDKSLVPLAEPIEYVSDDTVFRITLKKFGAGESSCRLIEDDFVSFDYRRGDMNTWEIKHKEGEAPVINITGNYAKTRYEIITF